MTTQGPTTINSIARVCGTGKDASCPHHLRSVTARRIECTICGRVGTMVDGLVNWDAQPKLSQVAASGCAQSQAAGESEAFISGISDSALAELTRLNSEVDSSRWHWAQCYELHDGFHWAIESDNSVKERKVVSHNLVLFTTSDGKAGLGVLNDSAAMLIPAMRNALPSLLAEIDRLKRENQRLSENAAQELPTYAPVSAGSLKPKHKVEFTFDERSEVPINAEDFPGSTVIPLADGRSILIPKVDPPPMEVRINTRGCDPLTPESAKSIGEAMVSLRVGINDAVEIVSLINTLRAPAGLGGTVTICCQNDDADDREHQEQVIIQANWTNWDNQRFYGATVLDAMRKASEAKRAAGGKS